jgi:hypothetical protein
MKLGNRRIRWGTFITIVVLLTVSGTLVQAQTPNCIIKLQVPPLTCKNAVSCHLIAKLSDTNFLFVLNSDTNQLLVFQPDGSSFGQYDLKSPDRSLPLYIKDFLPFGSTHIILFTGYHQKIYRYDLTTQVLSILNTYPSVNFISCSHPGIYQDTLFHLNTGGSVLGCFGGPTSIPGQQSMGVVTFNPETGSTSEIIQFRTQTGDIPWIAVIAGQDEQVYIETFYPVPNNPVESTDRAENFRVARYNTTTEIWSKILIPVANLPSNGWLGPLTAVDVNSNMYFPSGQDGAGKDEIRLIQVAPSGQVTGFLTAGDIGGIYRSILNVSVDGKLLIWTSFVDATTVSGEVRECTMPLQATPTPGS